MDPNKKADIFWAACVVSAFTSIISFFQINSYGADKNNTNGLFLVMGIVFFVAAVYSLYKVSQNTNTGKD
jgi:hypothetical protein